MEENPGGTGREGHGLPRPVRITGSDEIRDLFRRGKRRKTRHLDVLLSPSPSAFPRLGVVVPRHKRTIVERNRVKRRLKELGRTVLLPTLRNRAVAMDVLLRARPEAYGATFQELRAELATLAEDLCSRAR